MPKKEVKVTEKWIKDKFKQFAEEEEGLVLLSKVVAREMAWLRKQEAKFWKEVEKIHSLNPNYVHKYNIKTNTIREMYQKVGESF